MKQKYDVIVIGAGMSGLAAGIRLSMHGKSVCILERHSVAGGLNSYYRRGRREFDTGLHAMTNFTKKGHRGGPLSKILKQLRIPYDAFQLIEQNHCKVVFPDIALRFSNDIEELICEIDKSFPDQVDGFRSLLKLMENYNGVGQANKDSITAKEVLENYISNPVLREMIIYPLLAYGSWSESDIDFPQFVIMFNSIYLEGFCRPKGGIKTVLNLLIDRFRDLGGELRFNSEVESIETTIGGSGHRISSVRLTSGEVIEADELISSAGYPETSCLLKGKNKNHKDLNGLLPQVEAGQMSFTECILVADVKPQEFGIDSSIIFYNDSNTYKYKKAQGLVDKSSAIICFSNNFCEDDYDEGVFRITNIANYPEWKKLDKAKYKSEKERVYHDSKALLTKIAPTSSNRLKINFHDVFTPLTIERYTNRLEGAIYGATNKVKTGRTDVQGLYICGADHGLVGIVGCMLSGIMVANDLASSK